ncbi:hypothetical protein N7466_006054 [Penicillium verhagenii]|uniref:uncharacterized protein n=1 Tax=Penicillium verhagenii TaxID=1562060 RepID=UPI002544F925|nr:uncharacterized protein N7466_006054 [Penicillium verhagenii]KAJ5930561.1 hypothetical protein N7466_006054 [Penicillium verhagenii]
MAVILLQAGTVLAHEGDRIKVLRDHDILIVGNQIEDIGQGLTLPDECGARVIDCQGKIISPGFIDTHHHLWQSQMRGRFGNMKFMDYMVAGNMQSFNYTPEDIFWGQLAGCQESIHAGVTTVVDHAHLTYSPEHATEAIRASASSGLRTFFCYTPIWRIKNWASDAAIEFDEDLLPEWWLSTLDILARTAPFGEGRVRLGLGFDFFKLPKETVQNLWAKCRALGINLFTTHYVANYMKSALIPSIILVKYLNVPICSQIFLDSVSLLKEYDLLNSTILFSHINGIAESDAQTLLAHGAHFSSTPETELQMGLGEPVAFNPDLSSNASIGIDCHSNNSSDILTQLRLGMQHARGVQNVQAIKNGEYPSVTIKVEEMFNLGTIQGARAVNMADKIGSIEVGKLADIVIFDASSPGMVCAAEEDPLAAVLLHANVGDIEVVIVDGVVRKECGELVDVQLLSDIHGTPGEMVHQRDISKRLLESRERIIERGRGQDAGRGMEFLYKTFG